MNLRGSNLTLGIQSTMWSVAALVAVLHLAQIGAQECVLDNTTRVDWSKLTGVWYNTIAFDDPWSDVPKCRLMSLASYTDVELQFLMHGVPRKEKLVNESSSYIQKYVHISNSFYHPAIDQDMEEKKLEIDEEQTEGDISAVENILEMQDSYFYDPVSFVTDYQTFILEEQCRKADGKASMEKLAWIFTRVPNPSEAQFNQLKKLASSLGVVAELHVTDCPTAKPQEYIMP